MSKPKRIRVWKLLVACGLTALFIIPGAANAQAAGARFVAPASASHFGRSDLRAYINGGLKDGADKNFLIASNATGAPDSTYEKSHFNTAELNRIVPTEVKTIDYLSQTTYKTVDRFFLPSANIGINAVEPGKNYAYSPYWGADDIAPLNGASDLAADKLTNDRNRFIPKSFIPYGYTSTYVWTRSQGGDSMAVATRIASSALAANVANTGSIAPLLRIKIDDIAFAAAVSGDRTGDSQFTVEFDKAGLVSSENPNLTYGMHLKKLDKTPFVITGISYSSADRRLNIAYSGAITGKTLTFLAYSDANNYSIKAYTAAYMLTATSGIASIPINSWNITSLNGLSYAAWMETPAGENDAFASATAPYTYFNNGDRKLFALNSDLQCSWGDLNSITANQLLNAATNTYLLGANPTLQRINFGSVSASDPTKLQFWIAGRENASGQLSSAGDTIILYQSGVHDVTRFLSSVANYPAGYVSVSLPSGTGYTLADLGGTAISGVKSVLYDSAFSFKIVRAEGYDQDDKIIVKANDVLLGGTDDVYVIPKVQDDTVITISGPAINSYPVAMLEGGCIFTNTSNEPFTEEQFVTHGGTFRFKVQRKPGYDADPSFDVLLNGVILRPDGGGVYTASNIKAPVTLSIDGLNINKYAITLPIGNGYEIRDERGAVFAAAPFADYGSDFKFTVQLSAEFNRNTNINVTADGTQLSLVGGIYTIRNVTKTVAVAVSGLTVNNYIINFDPGPGSIIYTENGQPLSYPLTIVHGGSLKFKVGRKEGYEFSASLAVMANGVRLTAVDEVYSLPVIHDDYFLSIEELSLNLYTVTFPATAYYYAADAFGNPYPQPARASHGNDLLFQLVRMPGYDQNKNITVKANGVLLTPDPSGVYTIPSVKSNQTVTVEGLTINRYAITLTYSEGSIYTNSLGGDLNSIEYADWHTDFLFKVKLLPGYDMNADKLAVFADGVRITADLQGIYTLKSVSANIQISVSDISINTYSVLFPVHPGFVIMDDKGKIMEEHSLFRYGTALIFKVVRNTGYEQSNEITVTVNGIKVNLGANDYYSGGYVYEDKIVSVTGIKVNSYTITVLQGTGYILTDTANVPLGVSLQINYGQILSFKVQRLPGYDRDTHITVKANDNILEAASGVYTFAVNSDVQLRVTDLDINVYTVTFQNGVGFTVVSEDWTPLTSPLTITHGQYFEFKLLRHAGYENDAAVVKNNGAVLSANVVGAYVFLTLDRDLNLTINDLKLNTYTVTFAISTGYFYIDLNNKQQPASITVTHGESIAFKVYREVGYDRDPYITVLRNDTVMTPDINNAYMLLNISSNITLTVTDLVKNTYTIKYDANGGSGSIPDQAGIVHNTIAAISSGEQLKNGSLVLAGWSTVPNGQVVYQAGNISIPIIEDLILYAVWEKPNQDWILALAIASGVALLILIFVIVYVNRKKKA